MQGAFGIRGQIFVQVGSGETGWLKGRPLLIFKFPQSLQTSGGTSDWSEKKASSKAEKSPSREPERSSRPKFKGMSEFELSVTDWKSHLLAFELSSDEDQSFEHKDGAVLKLSGIDRRDWAECLRGSYVYLPKDLLVSAPGEELRLFEILGFEAEIAEGGNTPSLGKVTGFESNGAQDLALVQLTDSGLELPVPLVSNFIFRIDFEQKRIQFQVPPGYLQSVLNLK